MHAKMRPIINRLHGVEVWRKARWERLMECRASGAEVMKAALLYTEVAVRSNSIALSQVSIYRDS
jgi:hypothetical protein